MLRKILQNKIYCLSFLFLLCLSVRLGIILCVPSIIVSSDSHEYIQLSQSIYNNHSFVLNGTYCSYRTPGYPAFLALFRFAHIKTLYAVVFVQAILSSIECLLLFLLIHKYAGPRIACLASILYVFNPGSLLSVNSILTESLFSLTLLLTVYVLDRALSKPFKWSLFVSGVLMGCTALIRPIAQVLFIPSLLIIAFTKKSSKEILYASCLFILGIMMTQGTWMIRNYYHYGSFYLSEISAAAEYVYWAGDLKAKAAGDPPANYYEAAWKEWNKVSTTMTPPEMKAYFSKKFYDIIKKDWAYIPVIFFQGMIRQGIDSGAMRLIQNFFPKQNFSIHEIKTHFFHPDNAFDWLTALALFPVRGIELLVNIGLIVFALILLLICQYDSVPNIEGKIRTIYIAWGFFIVLFLLSSGPYANFRFREQYFSLMVFLSAINIRVIFAKI